MNEVLRLHIISSVSAEVLKVVWIEVQSPTGQFIVGPNHSPLISLVTPQSKLMYKKLDGAMGMFTIPGGIFRVEDNEAVILLDSPIGEGALQNS